MRDRARASSTLGHAGAIGGAELHTDGEHTEFDGAGAFQAPAVLGDELDEVSFDGAGRSEFRDIGGAVGLEGVGVFGGCDVDFGGRAWFERFE